MKLRVVIPQNDIDSSYRDELIIDGNDDSLLKEKGFLYAESKGEHREDLCWHGNIVMGDKPINSVKKWRMSLSNGSILIIE